MSDAEKVKENSDRAWLCIKEIDTDGDANPTGLEEAMNMITNALTEKDTLYESKIKELEAEIGKLNSRPPQHWRAKFEELEAKIARMEGVVECLKAIEEWDEHPCELALIDKVNHYRRRATQALQQLDEVNREEKKS